MKKNYQGLCEIIVKSQQELNDIPVDFEGRIYIGFGTYFRPAVVTKKYSGLVVAWENSSVEAWENSSVIAMGNSSVEAMGNSSVIAMGNSSVIAMGNSSVIAMGNSSVEAWGNSSVVAWENSSVEAWENSSVEARGNVQVVDYLQGAKVKVSGNARIVYMPKNIYDFMDFYGIKHTKTTATFYKAVRKRNGKYVADYNSNFVYEIGKTKTEQCDQNSSRTCASGIHISHLHWALSFGSSWNDLAILEVKTKIKDIILPDQTYGKVRTSEVKVIREVPLEECGLYGKMIARRIANSNKENK